MFPIIRSRVCSRIGTSTYRRPFSSSNPPPDPPAAAAATSAPTIIDKAAAAAVEQVPKPPPPPPEASAPPKKSWALLKAGLFAVVTGGVATAGYATYAYSLDEIKEKSKALRAYANYTAPEDASQLDKYKGLLFSGVMTVPAKYTELYLELRKFTEDQIRGFSDPPSDKLLPDLAPQEQHVFTLVLDLNETLIYSDWKRDRGWRTFKRPGVDAFLEHLAQFYEIVLYTDQMNMFLDPVLQKLDPQHCMRYRLDRVSTRYVDGKHYRDLSILNRDPSRILYVSAHAKETTLQPENAVQIKEWKGETGDTELLDLIPFLEFVAKARPADIRPVLESYKDQDIPKEFIKRSKEHQRRAQQQKPKRFFGQH